MLIKEKRNLHLVQRHSTLRKRPQSTLTKALGLYRGAQKGEKLLQDKQCCRVQKERFFNTDIFVAEKSTFVPTPVWSHGLFLAIYSYFCSCVCIHASWMQFLSMLITCQRLLMSLAAKKCNFSNYLQVLVVIAFMLIWRCVSDMLSKVNLN